MTYSRSNQKDKRKPRTESLIMTEGVSDWKHLKRALKVLKSEGKFESLSVSFKEWAPSDKVGNGALLKMCDSLSSFGDLNAIVICVFDSDSRDVNRHVASTEEGYRYWGNDVYSMILPPSIHYPGMTEVTIEHFYTSEDLRKRDEKGRRLFLSTEFDPTTRCLVADSQIICVSPKLMTKSVAIIDNHVFDLRGRNVAMSKSSFADRVLNGTGIFGDMNFRAFEDIYKRMDMILKNAG